MRNTPSLAPRSMYAKQERTDLNSTLGVLQAKNIAPSTNGWPHFQIPARLPVAASVAPAATRATVEMHKKAR